MIQKRMKKNEILDILSLNSIYLMYPVGISLAGLHFFSSEEVCIAHKAGTGQEKVVKTEYIGVVRRVSVNIFLVLYRFQEAIFSFGFKF